MRALLAIVVASALGPAASARGELVDTSGGCDRYEFCDYVIHVVAAAGEANHLSVTQVDGAPVFSDPAVPVNAGRRCTNVDAHTVTCLADVYGYPLSIRAGDLDDSVDASGYRGPVTIRGGSGDDVLTGSPSRDWLNGGPGTDRISGGYGRDWVSFAGTEGGVVVHLRSQTVRVGGHIEHFDGIENAAGGAGDDLLIGNAAANHLSGGLGDDRLYGERGPDRLSGGGGTDALRGGPGNDSSSAFPRTSAAGRAATWSSPRMRRTSSGVTASGWSFGGSAFRRSACMPRRACWGSPIRWWAGR